MDLSIEECEQLFFPQYCGSLEEKEEDESCKSNFVGNVCINCGEETEGTINYEKVFYTNKPKHNAILSLIDLRNLNLSDDIFSLTFEMYQQTMGNNIYR